MGYPITKHDLCALTAAAKLAHKSEMRSKHGAILYKRNEIIGQGYNKKKTHPGASYYYEYGFIHSEFDACHRIWDASGYDLAVVRINKYGELMNSQPCVECMKFLISKHIRFVIYSTQDGFHKIRLTN